MLKKNNKNDKNYQIKIIKINCFYLKKIKIKVILKSEIKNDKIKNVKLKLIKISVGAPHLHR